MLSGGDAAFMPSWAGRVRQPLARFECQAVAFRGTGWCSWGHPFEGADGDLTTYAIVRKAEKQADGTVIMTGNLCNAEDKTEKLGTFRAVAMPHTWKGSPTWSIISLRSKTDD